LLKHTKLSAREVAEEAMRVASSICVFTNDSYSVEEL
jgi:ATP-dependent HslUV protease subunit HslV